MNRRTDACPNGCMDDQGPVVVAPRVWTSYGDTARGVYRCPVCRRQWSTSFHVAIERVSFA